MEWLVNLDLLILKAEYPGLLAIGLGLLLGTVILPEVWRWAYNRFLDDPKANWPIKDAIDYIASKTRWAYENRSRQRWKSSIAIDIATRAHNGDINVWGQPHEGFGGRSLRFWGTETAVPPNHWLTHEIDIETVLSPQKRDFAQTIARDPHSETAKNELKYAKLRVDRRQIRHQRDWQPMPLWQRIIWMFSDGAR